VTIPSPLEEPTDRAPQLAVSSTHSSALEDVEVTRPRPGVVVVALRGEHDVLTKDPLGSLMERLVVENRTVLVDVTAAEFIDSSVIHMLISSDERARAAKKRLVLVLGTKPIVETALRASGVVNWLECANTVEEALFGA
jgi:anti-sigma B factor antagonist